MQPVCATSPSISTHCPLIKGRQRRRRKEEIQQHKQPPAAAGGGGTVHSLLASPLMAAAAAILTLSTPSFINPPASSGQPVTSRGAALFQKACIGCHDMGGNILQPGATLSRSDLQRNGFATEEDIYSITYYGKGRMPAIYFQGFGERCTPRGQCTFGPRLQEDEIKVLAEFVKLQADRGWPNIESQGD
ncbi:cytochrome c6, chloroplastic [Iris pallida]|uniref:Cytochrome c-553 n=1 Tax=Iris pallida TaxID=29817 RepID=A0AAX6HZ56_IRIPA|nr:cytochrome c6, chloroplastic [Iris pallida]